MRTRIRTWGARHPWAILASLGVGLGQVIRLPELSDPLGAPLPDGWQLGTPLLYTALAPLFSLWDNVAMLSRSRLGGFVLGLALAHLAWRVAVRWRRRVRWPRALMEEARAFLVAVLALGLFVAGGMAWNTRPPRPLTGLSAGEFTVELHSHTNASHDVQQWPVAGFDAAASRRWHQRAGIDLLFLTDHNTTAGWDRRGAAGLPGETALCQGIEISAHGAHVVVLGGAPLADPATYRGGPERRARLFAEVGSRPDLVAIASLPEYRGRARAFADEGVGGFEIVNASPEANDISRLERDSVIALARTRGLALVAAGDQHGYGATPMAWNVVNAPGWRRLGADPCALVVHRLRTGGPAALRITERTRLRPDHWLPGLLTPIGVLWVTWATLNPTLGLAWLVWIWLIALGRTALRDALRRRRTRAIMSAVGTLHHPSPGRR